MKEFQKWLGILLVAIAASGLIVACGDDEESCIADEDCSTGSICNFATETCAVECTSNAGACITGEEVCQKRSTDDRLICIATTTPGTNNGPGPGPGPGPTDECTYDTDCTGTDVCVSGVCMPKAQPAYKLVKVRDSSASCTADGKDPGSDIFGISLTKGGNEYFGKVISANILGSNNEHDDPDSILDGTPPAFSGACPEKFKGNVVALGCGGDVVVKFSNAQGQQLDIDSGDSITVFEWGQQCTGGTPGDAWTVILCNPATPQSEIEFDSGNCSGPNLGSGEAVGSVSVP